MRALAHGTATVEDRFTGKTTEIGASVIIDAGGRLPDDGLAQLVARGLTAGDAVAPRSVYEAILEARRAVLAAEARRRGAVSVSAGGRYRYLFSPIRLGPVVVANRVVFSDT